MTRFLYIYVKLKSNNADKIQRILHIVFKILKLLCKIWNYFIKYGITRANLELIITNFEINLQNYNISFSCI